MVYREATNDHGNIFTKIDEKWPWGQYEVLVRTRTACTVKQGEIKQEMSGLRKQKDRQSAML